MHVLPLAIYFPQYTSGAKSKIERDPVCRFTGKMLHSCCVAEGFIHSYDLEIFNLHIRVGEVWGNVIVVTHEFGSMKLAHQVEVKTVIHIVKSFTSFWVVDTDMVAEVKKVLVVIEDFLLDSLQGGIMVLRQGVLTSDVLPLWKGFTDFPINSQLELTLLSGKLNSRCSLSIVERSVLEPNVLAYQPGDRRCWLYTSRFHSDILSTYQGC